MGFFFVPRAASAATSYRHGLLPRAAAGCAGRDPATLSTGRFGYHSSSSARVGLGSTSIAFLELLVLAHVLKRRRGVRIPSFGSSAIGVLLSVLPVTGAARRAWGLRRPRPSCPCGLLPVWPAPRLGRCSIFSISRSAASFLMSRRISAMSPPANHAQRSCGRGSPGRRPAR